MNKKDKYIANLKSLKNKLILVTGANSGIGFEASKILAKKDAKIIMASRNQERLDEAKRKIINEYQNANLDTLIYDQASFESINSFADKLMNEYKDFDVLFLNAGIYCPKNDVTKDNIPLTIGVNFISLMKLFEIIKPFLEKSNKERKIIIEGSFVSRNVKYKNKDVDLIHSESNKMRAYKISKLGLENLFYYALDNFKNTKVKLYLSEPGLARTNIYRDFPSKKQKLWNWFSKFISHDAKQASFTTLEFIFNEYESGTVLAPKYNFHTRGFPIRINPKKKILKSKIMIDDAKGLYL